VEFRLLGPLEVIEQGQPMALGGPRQRAVLASLLLDANHVVSTDQLINRIWGDEPPDAAREALFAYVSRLRKLLGAGRIMARPPGYVLVAERDEIDALRFVDLVRDTQRASRDPAAIAAQLTQALDLWRGAALADLEGYDGLRPAIARLEELRLTALEDRTQAEIDLGRHRASVPVLESLVQEYPLRERLWSLLMLALYRSGRQADALGAFHRARTMLVEELGIDPSPDLRELYGRMLRQDPSLDVPSDMATSAPDHRGEAADTAAVESVNLRSPTARTSARERRSVLSRRRRLAIAATAAVIVPAVLAAAWLTQRPAGLPPGPWTIGVDMPLSGAGAERGGPVRNAVEMAVDEINATGGIDDSPLAVDVRDDADDPRQAAANAAAFVADPRAIAMIGPWGSSATFETISITNAGRMPQCSPASTHPGLTKPREGALDLRPTHPEAINFVRLPAADDIQAFALAAFAYRELRADAVLVIDDTGVGRLIADAFEQEFQKLGGSPTRRALNPGADPRTVLELLDGDTHPPTVVFFGGYGDRGADLRSAMVDAGHGSVPLLSWDFLLDGSGAKSGSYIQRVGTTAAVGSYVAHASLPNQKFSFADAYRQRFGAQPDEYAAAGYACVEIIRASLRAIAAAPASATDLRERLRAAIVDPTRRYQTVLGTVGFDANGDNLQQFVTFYRVEASAAGGAGDWVIFGKQDFGPAR
jgi:ABC-type branched-subunit amino acid transport system substrate-binding protein/DNA-binding SARP family transcriptional activator